MKQEVSFIVRDYTEKDYPHVAEIWERTGISTPGRGDTAEVIENTLRRNGGRCWCWTKRTTRVIGTSWLTNDGRRLYLHHFAIDPKFQGGGLSKPLLRESLQDRQRDRLADQARSARENERADPLLQKAGFKRLGDYDVYIIRDLTEIKE